MKRVEALWGKPFHRGNILWMPRLNPVLPRTDYVEFGKATVLTKDFRRVLNLVKTEDVLIRVNGGIEIQGVERYYVPNPECPGTRMCAHRLAKNSRPFYVKSQRNPSSKKTTVKIKIRQYCRKRRG